MPAEPILFVDHASALGGAERSLLLLLKHLDRQTWQPNLVAVHGPLLEEASRLDVKTHAVSLTRLRKSARFPLHLLRGAHSLAQLAKGIGASLIVANTVRAAVYVAPAAKWARLPFVWYMRDFWLSESRPGHPALDGIGKHLLIATAKTVIANSQAVARNLPASHKVCVVPNGIEVTAFDDSTAARFFRETYNIPPTAPLVGMIGRMRPWKGQLTFLDVADAVHLRAPQCRFLIVGGDPFAVADGYFASVKARAHDLGLQDLVTFTGHLSDVRPALAAMDLFVHPGDPEPFGLVNIEAMAASLPVVAFAHGALPEIVSDGMTGQLVPPGDNRAMVRAVLDLVSDVSSREKMGKAGRARAMRLFSIERVVTDIESILHESIEKKL